MNETNDIIHYIIKNTETNKFIKTLRGLKFCKVEFIFATDRGVIEDNSIVVKGKNIHYLRDTQLRNKLLNIYENVCSL